MAEGIELDIGYYVLGEVDTVTGLSRERKQLVLADGNKLVLVVLYGDDGVHCASVTAEHSEAIASNPDLTIHDRSGTRNALELSLLNGQSTDRTAPLESSS